MTYSAYYGSKAQFWLSLKDISKKECYFQGAILSRKGLTGPINYESSVVPGTVADSTWRISYLNFPQATNHQEVCSSPPRGIS